MGIIRPVCIIDRPFSTNNMKFQYLVIALAATMTTGGCASITMGTESNLYVEIPNCTESVECTATNKKGTWDFTGPGNVTFKKSDDALHIVCKDGEGLARRTVKPTKNEMVWGNVLFGGIIGGGVDANTDAHWETPESVNLYRETCRGKAVS